MAAGNHVVDTVQLKNCITRIEQISQRMRQVKSNLLDCLDELKQNWTSLEANDRNSYIATLNKSLVELEQFIVLLRNFKDLLDYYRLGYEEQANNGGAN